MSQILLQSSGAAYTRGPLTRQFIGDFGLGDDKTLLRTVENVDPTHPLASAKFIVKNANSDPDSNAIILKAVTPISGLAGQVTDTGSGDGVGALRFELVSADTALLPRAYGYAFQVTDTQGNQYTVEEGMISATLPRIDPGMPRRSPAWGMAAASFEPPPNGTKALAQELIDDFAQADAYYLTRTITGIPNGWTISSAIWTIRVASDQVDPGLLQQTVTPTLGPSGQVGDTGADGTGSVFFVLDPSQTQGLFGTLGFDVRVIITDGAGTFKRHTVSVGTLLVATSFPTTPVAPAPAAPIDHVVILDAPGSIGLGAFNLHAQAQDVANNPIPAIYSWASNNLPIATVSPTGLVTGVAFGSVRITVAATDGLNSASAWADIIVQTVVNQVTVTPSTFSMPKTVGTTQLAAVVQDISGNVLTGRTIVWTSSDPTKATVDSTGLVTPLLEGSVVITATCEGVAGTSLGTITALDRPPDQIPNLVLAYDPDFAGNAQAIVGAIPAITTPSKVSGTPGTTPSYYVFATGDTLNFGNVLNSVIAGGNPFSIMLGAQFVSGDHLAARMLISKLGDSLSQFFLEHSNNDQLHLRIYYANSTSNFEQQSSSALFSAATKYRAGFSFNPAASFGSRIKLYRNGSLLTSSGSTGGAGGTITSTTANLKVGADDRAAPVLPAPNLTYVYVWKVVLSDTEFSNNDAFVSTTKKWS